MYAAGVAAPGSNRSDRPAALRVRACTPKGARKPAPATPRSRRLQLRDWLGVETPPAALKLDYYNQIVASMFMGYSLYAAATGVRP